MVCFVARVGTLCGEDRYGFCGGNWYSLLYCLQLPILSAYLGHENITSTEKYLRLTEDRLSRITDSMQLHVPAIFPEALDDEEI